MKYKARLLLGITIIVIILFIFTSRAWFSQGETMITRSEIDTIQVMAGICALLYFLSDMGDKK